MATVTKHLKGTNAVPIAHDIDSKMLIFRNTIDFGVAANSVSAAATVQVLNIPARTHIFGTYNDVITKEWPTTAPGIIGDGADPNGWHTTSACQANTIAITRDNGAFSQTQTGSGTTNADQIEGKFYPTADTIDYVPTIAMNAAKIQFIARGVNIPESQI